jgi:hypothetical protein
MQETVNLWENSYGKCLPTAAARVCVRAEHVGFVMDTGVGFLRVLLFSLLIIILPISSSS